MPAHIKDLTGQRFGNLTAVAQNGRTSNGGVVWFCICDCGNTTRVAGGDLKKWQSDQIRSCGCRWREGTKKNITHGMSKSPEFKAWTSMLERCENPKDVNYDRYGARGIKVCNRWHKFENFFEDMGQRPSPQHSIDRKNNDGNYKPSNCRWATQKQQAQNRKSTVWLTYKGKTMCLSDWAKKLGISITALGRRLKRWSKVRALSTPKQKKYDHVRSKSHR